MSASPEVTIGVERRRLILSLSPGHTRAEAQKIAAAANIALGPLSGSAATGWTARSTRLDTIETVNGCLRSLSDAGYRARLAPEYGDRRGGTVLLLRIEDADAATAALHWRIQLDLEELAEIGPPAVATDGGNVVVVGLVEPGHPASPDNAA